MAASYGNPAHYASGGLVPHRPGMYDAPAPSRERVMNDMLNGMLAYARLQPNNTLEVRDAQGVVRATLVAHDLPTRPQDMPRHLRPRRRLSRRERQAQKHRRAGRPVAV